MGKGPKPKVFEKCLESWKKYCPDYEIIEWNEENLDLSKYKYAQDAYNEKKFAFASDVFRFDILYNYGGIYLDTDVELLKPIDEFLNEVFFTGFESKTTVCPGLICGSEKENLICKFMLDYYANADFKADRENGETVCSIFTRIVKDKGLKLNNKTQRLNGLTIYSSEYFCPIDPIRSTKKITKNTYSIHWYDASWYSSKQKFKHKIKVVLNKLSFGLFGVLHSRMRKKSK